MMTKVSGHLQTERDALIEEIHAAFWSVTREGGVSWSEATVIDDCGSKRKRDEARARDVDSSWVQLTSDDEWVAGPGIGGWSFLDPIGFRYYLPAAMIKMIEVGHAAFPCNSLDIVLLADSDYRQNQFSLLDERQRRCVARFIKHMIAWEEEIWRPKWPDYEATGWRKARDGYWKAFE